MGLDRHIKPEDRTHTTRACAGMYRQELGTPPLYSPISTLAGGVSVLLRRRAAKSSRLYIVHVGYSLALVTCANNEFCSARASCDVCLPRALGRSHRTLELPGACPTSRIVVTPEMEVVHCRGACISRRGASEFRGPTEERCRKNAFRLTQAKRGRA